MTTVGWPGRRRFVPSARRLAVMVAAAACTVLLAQHATTAAFTGQTGDGGNSATTAATFCTSPSSAQLTPIADTAVYQANPNTNYSSTTGIGIRSDTAANAYSYVKFDLAAAGIPARCTVTSATLSIRRVHPWSGRPSRRIGRMLPGTRQP